MGELSITLKLIIKLYFQTNERLAKTRVDEYTNIKEQTTTQENIRRI